MADKPVITGLPADFISELMANSRQRNAYGPKLLEFLQSDEAAINPRDVWPAEFANKKSSTMYQGFNNAIKKGDIKGLRIAQHNDEVFILNTEKVEALLAESA